MIETQVTIQLLIFIGAVSQIIAGHDVDITDFPGSVLAQELNIK